MKTLKTIVIIVFSFLISISITNASSIIYNDDGTIHLNADDLKNLKSEELEKVTQVIIKNEFPNNESIEILEKCTNLDVININLVSEGKLSKLNKLKSSKGLSIYILTSIIDFDSINNPYIKALNVANSLTSNFEDIESLSNLEQLGLSETTGYKTLDFSKLTKLKSLTLATYIDDFDKLTQSIPNVTSLSLSASNIQNKDSVYLKRLTNLESLYLNQTYLTDIDFVKDLPKLESLTLPWSVYDLSPIYQINNLKNLYWEAYTGLNVTQELIDYLDSKSINHYDYNPETKIKINKIIEDLNITPNTDAKKALEKITRYIVENTDPDINYASTVPSNQTTLDIMILHNKGVCYGHSIALYTIAKAAGIQDIYAVSGILYTYMNKITGDNDGGAYGLMAHAWNIVDYNGTIYSIDAAQMNNGSFSVEDYELAEEFWKNPLKDDDYDLDYAYANYLDFNYHYAKRHEETDGILKQTRTYTFKNVKDLDIKNHTIYNYDTSDTNATKLCSNVLDNYTCEYIDNDSNNKISTGDKIQIKKANKIVETFTLSTTKWVKPKEPTLSGITMEYENYPDKKIEYKISTLYYNKDNQLILKLKGENYEEDKAYPVKLIIEGENLNYEKDYTFTGKEINSGISITLAGNLLTPKEPPKGDEFMGSVQYFVRIIVDEKERTSGIDYIIEEEKESEKEEEKPSETPEIKDEKPEEEKEENPNTSDRTIIITIISLISLILITFNKKPLKWLN